MTNEKAIKNVTYMRNSLDPLSERKLIESLDMAIEALRKQDQALNEWCTDCKEYDQEKHCCPRFNRVIESALEDATDANVGDTVSRKAAIVTLHDEILRRRINHIEPIDEFDTESILRQLPSVEHPNSSETPNNSDMVSRQAVIDINAYYHGQMPNEVNYEIYKKLIQLPSVEPKTGEWIYGEDDSGQDGWTCSECGFFVPWYYDYYGLNNIDFIRDFHTCPHCEARMLTYTGAKMEVEHE